MNRFFRSVVVVIAAVVVGAVVACGGSSTSGNGSSGIGGGTGPGGSCSLAAGMYTEHAVAEAGGMNCPAIPDQTVPVSGGSMPSLGMMMSTTSDAGGGCTTNQSGCTITASCSQMVAGLVAQYSFTFIIGNNSASGKEMISITSQGMTINCTYDISLTKI